MPDILTHVLVGYVLGTLVSFRLQWLTPQHVTVTMLGAMVPDLTKIKLLVPSTQVELWLGLPFDWFAIHTLGGALVAVAIGALCTAGQHRRRVFGLLILGAISHLSLDALLINASGYSYAVFFPFSAVHPPTPGLFLSSDRWPAAVGAVLAGAIWTLRRRYRPGHGS
ncbi:metal-dependent hydrolase [Natronomonas salsuginis]|uniref:Metal-dependent hydrolase n=1 Tax=Natronomonas salsuginis TaxID=2217661 RepID=A0A4U5JHB3_9EURY|nr:metal-dependent hydrolase [Natronomonas salsuginis]TKR25449.1 metal-dependent hydrolase [Natronomonas salsuginis]